MGSMLSLKTLPKTLQSGIGDANLHVAELFSFIQLTTR